MMGSSTLNLKIVKVTSGWLIRLHGSYEHIVQIHNPKILFENLKEKLVALTAMFPTFIVPDFIICLHKFLHYIIVNERFEALQYLSKK